MSMEGTMAHDKRPIDRVQRRSIGRRSPAGCVAAGTARGGWAGFTLIEINLAVMLIAVGLLVLFSLFPAGLKQGDSAYRNTQAGLFADQILNAVRLNVDNIATWADWTTMGTFSAAAVAGLPVAPTLPRTSVALEFPAGSGNWVRYMLVFDDHSERRSASLWVWGGRYGPTDPELFRRRSHWFYTEFYYTGGPAPHDTGSPASHDAGGPDA